MAGETKFLIHRMSNKSEKISPGKVAIVVVASNEVVPLDKCIEGFRALMEDPKDVVFVDNGSGGHMKEWVHSRYPDVTVVEREKNGHFCGGYNTGLQFGIDHNYEFSLFVNADTSVENPGFMADLLESAKRNPKAAFLGPLVYFRNANVVQNTILRFPGFWRNVYDWFAFRWFPKKQLSEIREERSVEFLNGVCVLARSEALKEVGLFDETLAIYVEDTDLHWRARAKGWHSRYVPTPSIVHHQKATGYDHCSLASFMLRRNTVYWHMKRGRYLEAWSYAKCSLFLARIRAFLNRHNEEKVAEYRYYLERSRDAYSKLLRREPLGEWFGPLLGKWDPPVGNG